LVATTVTVYVAPVVKPVIDIGEEVPVAVVKAPPEEFLAIAVYPVITPPPTFNGAVNVIETEVGVNTVAVPIVGALGTCNGLYEAVINPPR
jgi:hypothetical protein